MKVIADLLKLSEKTGEFLKHHIMESFNLKSNADLVLFALKHQLISVPPEPCGQVRTQRPGAWNFLRMQSGRLGISPVARLRYTALVSTPVSPLPRKPSMRR